MPLIKIVLYNSINILLTIITPKTRKGNKIMNAKIIMSTVYNVLMDEGYRPKKEKPCPDHTILTFKAQGIPLMIPASDDNYITISAGLKMRYTKEFGRLDVYKLVNQYYCMKVERVEFQDNKSYLCLIISYQTLAFNSNDVKEIIENGIETITCCIEELEEIGQ